MTVTVPADRTVPLPVREPRALELARMRERIAAGEYRVDPRAVADAIVERLGAGRSARRPA